MVKKYYQGKKDRMDESRGMKRYEEKHKGRMDSGYMGMISEDHSAPANLPQGVKHEYYPKCDYVDSYYMDDSIKGIDEASGESVRKVEHNHPDSKY